MGALQSAALQIGIVVAGCVGALLSQIATALIGACIGALLGTLVVGALFMQKWTQSVVERFLERPFAGASFDERGVAEAPRRYGAAPEGSSAAERAEEKGMET